jgi:hypothetical protein
LAHDISQKHLSSKSCLNPTKFDRNYASNSYSILKVISKEKFSSDFRKKITKELIMV